MAKFLKRYMGQREKFQRKVLKHMHAREFPVYLGELSLVLGESIELTQECMDDMAAQEDAQVERVPPSELPSSAEATAVIYRLRVPVSLSLARG